MKAPFSSLLILLINFTVCAQSIRLKIADSEYNNMNYSEAIRYYAEYLSSHPDDSSVNKKIAVCYRMTGGLKNAKPYYCKLIKLGDNDPYNYLYYAQALAQNLKYDSAAIWYTRFSIVKPRDKRGKRMAEAYNNIAIFYTDTLYYKIKPVSFNSPQSDFSPAYFKNGLVYLSNRSKGSGEKFPAEEKKTNFLTYYFFDFADSSVKNFIPGIASKLNEGPATFNAEQNVIFFTQNNDFKAGKNKSGRTTLQIYSANLKNGKWGKFEKLPFEKDEYSYGHPALNKNNTLLYFISDMPGGYGGTDIYVCEYKNGIWGTPANLGPIINTEGNEMFPFVDEMDNLYFASDGHPGLGGLDIFKATPENGTYKEVKNIGSPVNSNDDDFGWIIDKRNNTGYFCSNRPGGAGNDDIYSFKFNSPSIELSLVDKTNEQPVDSALVELFSNQDSIKTFVTALNGSCTINYDAKKNYELQITKKGYLPYYFKFSSEILPDMEEIRVPLSSNVDCSLQGMAVKDDGKEPVAGANIILLNLATGKVAKVITGNDGKYRFNLRPNFKYNLSVDIPDKNFISPVLNIS
ncbi:MAG: carboxypeptidase-like regulatory domain-containing protein, partial [Bacteroidota bacterium]|nr:carboxypeptidase-like regulatory domain-containing protein [Bacteroidota bacterium]